MPNVLTLTTPIQVPNLTRARIVRISERDDDAKLMTVQVQLVSNSGVVHPVLWQLQVANGLSTRLVVNPSPVTIDDVVGYGSISTPTGYDTVLAADTGAARRDGVLNALRTLGILPAGAVA